MSEQALSGVKVLDLTWHIAGPYCTKFLADYGADVIKIERPGDGDPSRRKGPFLGDDPHPDKSGLFLYLNTNKKSITLNLKSETGKKIFKKLVKDTDILVESFSPRVLPSLGLDYETLEKINPKLVMTSISNFGQTGPYRDYKASEHILYGMGGEMYTTGVEDRHPIKLGGSVIQFQAGNLAAALTMFAFFVASTQGVGQHVDISMMETQLGTIDRRTTFMLAHQYRGDLMVRAELGGGAGFPFGYYHCKDGIFTIAGGLMWFPKVCKMIGHPELATDPYWSGWDAQTNPEREDEFYAKYWYPYLAERTKLECFNDGQKAGALCAPLNTVGDIVEDPHMNERGYFVEIDHPVTGKQKYPGAQFKCQDMQWQIRRSAPLLGQHNEEVFGKLGYSKEELVILRERGGI